MQFGSPSYSLGIASAWWRRAKELVPMSTLWSLLLVLLLTYTIATSTATAAWVPGVDALPKIALLGALTIGMLSVVKGVRWPVVLAAGVVIGALVVGIAVGGTVMARNGADPHDFRLVVIWVSRIADGSAFSDLGFVLYVTCWLMWITGGWLAWCTLHLRSPLIGLIPGALAFATNVLNYPANQNGYVLSFLLITLGLMLWSNYNRSVSNARSAHVRLTGDARWDFWESGLVAMAALIVVGIMLPPLSTVDRTTQFESGIFAQWAQLQARLAHPVAPGAGTGFGSTGFSTEVSLGGALRRSPVVVMTYATEGNYVGPRYFRGVDEVVTVNGQWGTVTNPPLKARLGSGTMPQYAEQFTGAALGAINIKMLAPPTVSPDILFYPGRLLSINRDTIVWGSDLTPGPSSPLVSIDRLVSYRPPTSAGPYRVTVEYSAASEDQLRSAGTAYPDFLPGFYSSLPLQGYRAPILEDAIRRLALKVTAGATNPYDKVAAIETYLRDSQNFQYTLTPPTTPLGQDPIQFFLFNSHKGYCEFFATAMGDMLRSIGIPTRLVNGFGPGAFDSASGQWVVRGQDAHTWVEVYFPTYGWITFEPTDDGTYLPVPRGTQGETVCIREQGCTNPNIPGTTGGEASPKPKTNVKDLPTDIATNSPFSAPDAGTLFKIVGIALGGILLIVAAGVRYLRPRNTNTVWKRAILLASLAGAERKEGETPFEIGNRLAWRFPEAAEPFHALADGFVIAAYAPPEVAVTARGPVLEAWTALRPLLLRRVFQRIRPV